MFRKLIHRIAGKKLYETFGGRLRFFGIGGAKLDSRVERFLKEAKFPYAIGYGLTETAPLLAGAGTHQTKLQSTGFAVQGVALKIHEPNKKGVGEIWAKKPNVMKRYSPIFITIASPFLKPRNNRIGKFEKLIL